VPRAPLPGATDVDVAIVGGGFTGLWTAYYLKKADPHLRVAVLEKEFAGYGASGRNGGWCSGLFAASHEVVAKSSSRAAAQAMQRAMFETVDEVGRVMAAESIAAGYHKGGVLSLATAPEQLDRLQADVDYERSWGFGEEDFRWLGADQVGERIKVAGCLGGSYTPHCASLDPGRLVRGLAEVVEKLGVAIYEDTAVLRIEPRLAVTESGPVRANVVVRALEGYTPSLPGFRRHLIPTYSLMIATSPLPQAFWEEVGWAGRENFTDGRHLYIYAMRTEDDRIALGGRGAPYHYASSLDPANENVPHVFANLYHTLRRLFPAIGRVPVTHAWGGPLGIPRDWYPSVGLDRGTGLAWGGGYVGDGVASSNLAGRTLADLILERQSELTQLPWVNHRSRLWEPEPLRWLGVRASLALFDSADRKERGTGKPAKRADLMHKILPI
jgi:glycine/D-amino acid oxidase-like deaminating enzyme